MTRLGRPARFVRGLLASAAAASILASNVCARDAQSIDGIWYSRAYGTVLDLRLRTPVAYDINPAICLRQIPSERDRRLFRDPHLEQGGQVLNVQAPSAITRIRYQRIAAVPRSCLAPVRNARDRLLNFDAFWNWYAQNYAFFPERGVNWSQIGQMYRGRAAKASSDDELLEIFRSMIETLHDRHTFIGTGDRYINASLSPTFERWSSEYSSRHADLTGFGDYLISSSKETLRSSWAKHLDPGSVRELGKSVVTGTAEGGQIGYLQLLAESDFADTHDVDEDTAAAARLLDNVFRGYAGKRGLIIDLRFNFGGDDQVGLIVAGLLTAEDRLGFSKCTRDGAGFTPTQPVPVSARPAAFTGPVVILSGNDNVSAGENIAMMARTLPNVIIVGEPSASVHSDVLEKKLPNGWTIGVSNEAFVSPDGTMYESVGIPPDIYIPFDSETVRRTGEDPVLTKALELIGEQGFRTALATKRGALGRPSPCRLLPVESNTVGASAQRQISVLPEP